MHVILSMVIEIFVRSLIGRKDCENVPPRSRCALMMRPIQTKIGHDQTHPDDNLP